MIPRLLNIFVCPSCSSPLDREVFNYHNQSVIEGVLSCNQCSIDIPICNGFPLFSSATTSHNESQKQAWVQECGESMCGGVEYKDFLRIKSERQIYDSYALFQPFNESTRSLLALVEPLRARLSPGDIILDTWCRTGWMGEWLASLFPEQHIISIWEGNSNVLGYKGFTHWLPEQKRIKNLSIIFTHPDDTFPIATDSVSLVIGLDSLHRYSQTSFLAESRRVTVPEGVLFFPHIHLTNSEPEPFFERGCHQMHGKDWHALLKTLYPDESSFKGFLFSETKLFECGDSFVIKDDCNTSHYNGAVLIAPKEWDGMKVSTAHNSPIDPEDRLILNPLLNIDLTRQQVSLDSERIPHLVDDLLMRHPIYSQRIAHVLGEELSEIECKVLFFAKHFNTVTEIATSLSCTLNDVCNVVAHLYHREIVFPARISESMAHLQTYYGTLEYRQSVPSSFCGLWQELPERYNKTPVIEAEDGSIYDWDSTKILVESTLSWLLANTSLQDRVMISTDNCPELFIVTWACWLTGRIVVPVDKTLSKQHKLDIIDRISPKIIFSSEPLGGHQYNFDSLATDEPVALFSDQIAPFIDPESKLELPETIDPESGALLLFTSGSTGQPKAVLLNQTSLLHSAHNLVGHFAWPAGSRLFSLGAAHTMSGIRNPAIGALFSGSTIILPNPGIMHSERLFQLLKDLKVSHLSTIPALIQQLSLSKERLMTESLPSELKQISCTGQPLPNSIRDDISDWLGIPIYSYYGLTETGGFCCSEIPGKNLDGSLGLPLGSIAQVVDANKQIEKNTDIGELRIFSPANMLGYWESSTESSVSLHEGWIYTGDIVRLMPDGSLDYLGRKDDQAKNQTGEAIHLHQIEKAINVLPSVNDACCLYMAHSDLTTPQIILFIVDSRQNPEQFEAQFYAEIDRTLGSRNRPDKIIFSPLIERMANGKVNRAGLRDYLRSKAVNV